MSGHSSSNQPRSEPFQPAAAEAGEEGTQQSATPGGQSGGTGGGAGARPTRQSADADRHGSAVPQPERTAGQGAAVPRSSQPGTARRQPGAMGEAPAGSFGGGARPAGEGPDEGGGAAPRLAAAGDAADVAVAHEQAAAGTSERTPPIETAGQPAIAAPGKPDGEADTSR